MVVSLVWASNLPVPILSNYSLQQSTGLSYTEFSTGKKRSRVLPNRPSTMKATWYLSESESELFEAALEYTYLGVRFLMTAKLPRMDRLQKLEVLITKDPRDSRKSISNSSKRWEYNAEILVKKLPNLDEGVYDLVMDMNVTLQHAVDLLDALEYMLKG